MKGIPSNEKIWLTRVFPNGEMYYITSKATRDCYYLYKDNDGTAKKIAKGKNPLELEARI